jgi:hypothetical protein
MNVYLELYGRIPPLVREAVDGLSADQLRHRVGPDANPIGWLIWHLTRVEDHHIAELVEGEQLWVADGWADRFGMTADPSDVGYGHTSEQVAAVPATDASLLVAYHEAVDARARAFLADHGDLDRIVDRRWDPPVTLGVRLVSIADDALQHLGQAAYVRGLISPSS